ncbi:hypothetical protein niasHT_037773 [Heterodera trifolii]|uniref:Uncharacterized protein n=1 Tax=Heterodera trifolii TaxID=157864 RepID=A0ABD2J7W7_9BILA
MSNSSDEQQQQQGNGQSQNGSNRASLNNAQANSSHSISPEVEEQFHGQPPVVFRNGCGIEDMEAFWEQAQKIQTDNHQLSERVSSLTREHNTLLVDHNTLRTDYNTLRTEHERILQRQLDEFDYWILCFAFFIPPLSILATARNNGLSFPVTVLSALAATIFCAFLWIPGILFALAFYFVFVISNNDHHRRNLLDGPPAGYCSSSEDEEEFAVSRGAMPCSSAVGARNEIETNGTPRTGPKGVLADFERSRREMMAKASLEQAKFLEVANRFSLSQKPTTEDGDEDELQRI